MNLDPVQRLLAERACERLIVEYSHRLDLGEPESVAELFAEDAVWEMPGLMRFEGRADLAAGFRDRLWRVGRTSRHVCTNVAIDVVTADEATGLAYLINYRYDPPSGIVEQPAPSGEPRYIGEYHDRFVRCPEGWRFAYRRAQLAFAGRGA